MRSTIPGFCRDMPWLLYGHASDFVGTCLGFCRDIFHTRQRACCIWDMHKNQNQPYRLNTGLMILNEH